MTDQSFVVHLRRKAAVGGRRMLVGGLSFALLAAGMTGVGLAGSSGIAQAQVPAVSAGVAAETTIGTYTNGQASITVKKVVNGTGSNTVVAFVADVDVTKSSASTMRSAFAKNTFGNRIMEPVSTMARNNNAVLAINTDFYGFRSDGIVIRNGTAYRDKGVRHGAGILRDGDLMLYDETKYSAAQLVASNVLQGLSFGPHLVNNGQVVSGIETYEIGDFGPVQPGAPGSIQGLQPRTGIGMISKNHFVLIVVDGRNANGSRGVTMPEFAQLFVNVGAKSAMNLDGGGSATMYFNGSVVNKPSFGSERPTSDILYVAR